MNSRAPLAGLLACPQCLSPLIGGGCLSCRTDYPSIAGIPWLMPEPRAALIEWRGRLHHLLTHYAAEASRQRSALAKNVCGAATRRRLEHVAAALDDQAARIRELMQPLGFERRSEAHAVHVALGTELPMAQGLSSYYTNLHRDWCWGEAENRAAAAAVIDSLPAGARPERLLVLGAGACRLAYDLHQSLTPTLTVALDINPLFLFAAKRILSGGALELYEFPIAARTIADHAVLRTLTAPGHATPGLELVLADAAAPPFLAGSFDLVLTPWFIDVAGEPVRRQLNRLNRVLRTGGYWINQGSLACAEAAPADAVSLQELLEWLPESGFSRATPQESVGAYLVSPASRHARRETVITFCTRKERDVASPDQGRPVPEWLRRSDLPVPALPQIRAQALASRVHAFLLAMIDGERSIRDMARLMEQQQLMMAEDAEPAIRHFLARSLADSTRPPAF